MINAAIVVAGESTAAEAHEFLAAVTGATGAGVEVVALIDAPGAVVLHALPDGSAHVADGLTLVLFCGHLVRDYDGRLFFSSRADQLPTLLTAVPIDAVRDVIRSSREPIVVIFDCTFADDERGGAGGDRLGALEQSFAGLAFGVLVSNVRSMGLDGGLTRRLAEGIASRDADLDRDGVVTIDELFAYARRRVEQVAIPQHCITSSSRAGGVEVVRFRDPNLFEDDVQFSVYRPRALQPELEYGMVVFAHRAAEPPTAAVAYDNHSDGRLAAMGRGGGLAIRAVRRGDRVRSTRAPVSVARRHVRGNVLAARVARRRRPPGARSGLGVPRRGAHRRRASQHSCRRMGGDAGGRRQRRVGAGEAVSQALRLVLSPRPRRRGTGRHDRANDGRWVRARLEPIACACRVGSEAARVHPGS